MSRRVSIYVPGFAHKNPVPAACRIGQFVMAGGIHGIDPHTGELAPGLEAQCNLMFQHVESVIAAAGGTLDDIMKMTFWMQDKSCRPLLNERWTALFPDSASRPARHTLRGNLEGGMLIQCDFTALLSDP